MAGNGESRARLWQAERDDGGPIIQKAEKSRVLAALIIWALGIYPLAQGILLLEQGAGVLTGLALATLKFAAYFYFFALWPIYGLVDKIGKKKQ